MRSLLSVAGRHHFRTSGKILPLRSISSTRPFLSKDNIVDSNSTILEIGSAVADHGPGEVVRQLGYHPFDFACQFIHETHLLLDIPYWASIVACTAVIRVVLFPVAVSTMKSQSRMLEVQPIIGELKKKIDLNSTPELQAQYMKDVQRIYMENDIKPARLFLMPALQMPVFVSFFFGLQQMIEILPQVEFLPSKTLRWQTPPTLCPR
jgi:YidC/Oxa1 family membrane protein insertase